MAGRIEPPGQGRPDGVAAPAPSWAPLREELRLSEGPRSAFGSPTWTLHDPAAHRFFRIGWLEFEVLSRWSLGSAEAVRRALCRETTLSPSAASIQAVYDFALRNSLLLAARPGDTERLLSMAERGKTSWRHKVVHGYLFLRIPLASPDGWLGRNLYLVRWMFARRFALILLCLAALGVYLISREWTAFFMGLKEASSWRSSLLVLVSLGLAKAAHELGHAFAAKLLGLKVPRMGVALMCFMPVLWTDVTESWKLPKRSDRLLIDLAGVGAELLLAVAASLLWAMLPPGEGQSAMLTLAGVAWIATLAVNANPFMRYDGYYILSDYWEMPDLQQRAFALARWRLREFIFGFGDPPPEAFPAFVRRKLLIYAYITWLYRFFLFFGIALLVYHLFFKAMGLILMMVEMVWFIALPIYRELAHWYARRQAIALTRRTLLASAFALGCVALLIIPWRSGVQGAAIFSLARAVTLYAQHPARLESLFARPGERVEAGRELMRLDSPDLDAQIHIARSELTALRSRLALASLDPALRISYAADEQEMLSMISELEGLLEKRKHLSVTAPFSGTFHDTPLWLTPGAWLPERTPLGMITDGPGLVSAYVAEEDMERLEAGVKGRFYPVSGFFEPLAVTVVSMERSAVRDLPHKELAIVGGLLPARTTREGRLAPEQALYRVICLVEEETMPPFSVIGKVALDGKRRSFALRLWRAALGLAIRESGLE